jgi:hypothetical protein
MSEVGIKRKIVFDPSFNLGHVIQVVVIIIPVVLWGIRVETRQNQLEDRMIAITREMARNEDLMRERLVDIKDTLRRIEVKVDNKVDRHNGGAW